VASIEDVKRKNEGWLMALPGVVGVGIGKKAGTRVIQVYVKEFSNVIRDKVPAMIDGHPTDVLKVGDVRRL